MENIRSDLPPALCRIVHKLLEKDPQDRYASPRELRHDLRTIQLPDDEPWEAIDELPPEERKALATIGMATQHLAAVMKTSSLPLIRNASTPLSRSRALVAFAAGGLLAWETRPPLLAVHRGLQKVTDLGSVEYQYLFASMTSTDREAWLKSVEKYYPRHREEVAKANEELALYYLQMGREWEAQLLFEELAANPEPPHKAFGLAGVSHVLVRQEDYEKALEALMLLAPLRNSLADTRMSALVAIALDEVKKHRGQEVAAEWEEWRKSVQAAEEAEN